MIEVTTLLNPELMQLLASICMAGGMIIMHDFGDGPRVTDVYVASLEDGSYSVKWSPGSKSFIPMDEATLKSKALEARRMDVLNDNATFTRNDIFSFTDEELGLEVQEVAAPIAQPAAAPAAPVAQPIAVPTPA